MYSIIWAQILRDKIVYMDICLTHLSTYLKNTQLVTKLSWTQFTRMVLVVSVGDLETSAPLTSAEVMRLKRLFRKTDNSQEHKNQRQIEYIFKFSATNHTMLLGRSKNYLAFYLLIFQKDFLIAVSNMLSFFKVLQKGLGTVVYGNRADPNQTPLNLKANSPALQLLFLL